MPETEYEQVLPPDDDDADADGLLDTLTDEEWRRSHEALRGIIPDEELQHVWAPGQSPEELGL